MKRTNIRSLFALLSLLLLLSSFGCQTPKTPQDTIRETRQETIQETHEILGFAELDKAPPVKGTARAEDIIKVYFDDLQDMQRMGSLAVNLETSVVFVDPNSRSSLDHYEPDETLRQEDRDVLIKLIDRLGILTWKDRYGEDVTADPSVEDGDGRFEMLIQFSDGTVKSCHVYYDGSEDYPEGFEEAREKLIAYKNEIW